MDQEQINRRDFMSQAGKIAAGLAAGLAPLAGSTGCATMERQIAGIPNEKIVEAASKSPRKPDEKIRLGFIGTGGRGRNLMQRFGENPEVEFMAICDVNKEQRDEAVKLSPPNIAQTEDYRVILSNPNIDAVVIATPDHWHAIITIEACQAGKDVYVEKPLNLCIEEGKRMVRAARRHGRVVQMGTQQLSGEHYHQARDLVRAGELGKVTMVRTWNFRNAMPGRGDQPDGPTPPTFNWDRWLGPRPIAPYNPLKARGGFRHFWDYAGGVLTDWGVHHFHSVLDIMGYEPPLAVSAAGGRYALKDITNIPDNISVLYQFPDWTLEYSNRDTNGQAPYGSEYGLEFCGTTATMYLDRKGFMIFQEKDRANPRIVGQPTKDNFLPTGLDQAHIANFVKCVRSREHPASDVEAGHKATTLAHLGNIAYRTGRQVIWDGARETILNNPEGEKLLTRNYRAPYLLPEV